MSSTFARQTTAADLTGTLQALARPQLTAKPAGTCGGGVFPLRPVFDVFEGETKVGYVIEYSRTSPTTYDWHIDGDSGWSDSMPEALADMRAAMVELAQDRADYAERLAEIKALPEAARAAEKASVAAEIAHLVATRRNILDEAEVRATRKAWDDARAVALTERLRGSLELIDAERAA